MKIPERQHTTVNAIYKHYESRKDYPRYHLGASAIGHPCERYLWLNFRWCLPKGQFSGRMLKLFQRGHDEEAKVIADLRTVGCKVSEINQDTGKQWHVSFSAHFSGSCDGIIESGLIESPKKRHVLEIKTHNKKSFDDLEKKGVQESKPQHYAQMQVYMLGLGIDRAYYLSVCKDDDRLYGERVKFDPETANRLKDRGVRITLANNAPARLSENPTWYECKMCAGYDLCHGDKLTKNANCRTCAHSTATETGWRCELYDGDIPKEFQAQGCRDHVIHPDLTPWQQLEGNGVGAVYQINGYSVTNGRDGMDSREIIKTIAGD